MNTKSISPELEHDYLCYYSKLSIAIGAFLSLVSIDTVFNLSEMNAIANAAFYVMAGVTLIATLWFLFAGNKFSKYSLSKNAWTGTYEDEFLNSVNLTAYKLSYFAVAAFAAVGIMGGFSHAMITTEVMGVMVLAVCLLTYGLTALYQLSAHDE